MDRVGLERDAVLGASLWMAVGDDFDFVDGDATTNGRAAA